MSGSEDNVVANNVESSDGEETGTNNKKSFESFLSNPAYMTSVMRRQLLQSMVKELPETCQKRIKAMKNLQVDYLKLESQFFVDVYELECKYQEKYQSILDKRKQILNGLYEPKDDECKWEMEEEDEDEEISEKMQKITMDMKKSMPKYPEDCKGVPDFWLTVFKNTEILSDMVQSHDEPILKKLQDISIVYHKEPMSYVLEFHFAPNEYFKDSILKKTYFLRCKIDAEDPFVFEGPEIFKCTGCVINWNPSKNVTVKTIKKTQKHKSRGAFRTISKQVPNDSFFNFFNPPEVPEDESKLDEESQNILGTDFEIGHFLRARIIPKAVLYYTGEVDDDDDIDDEEEEEEEEDEEEEEEGEEEEDEVEEKPARTGGKKGNTGGGGKKKEAQNPAECQQQ
uniref:Putative nucleosome assembly protein nap-1 n=1 Tax=Corethrella appendiculata TaxID=1370023 RepID=U5EZ93_9DIPT